MNTFAKSSLAGITLSAFLVNQIHAYMPQISFEAPDYTSGSTVGAVQGSGWNLLEGSASVSPVGTGYLGGQALKLAANPNQEALIKRSVVWDEAEKVAFIDLMIKPAADPEGSYASFFANGTQLAFQVPMGGQTGEVWVYNGSGGTANAAQWAKTVGTFTLASGGLTASGYTRITLRHDYQRNIWDLFIEGKLAAANLAFEGRGANLEEIELYGSKTGDTLIDDLSAQTSNMLFEDDDKDGLPNAWERDNGSNENLYDRETIKAGTGKSFLDLYMDSLWLGGLNGKAALPAQGSIPPLTIIGSHQPVSSLKGSMSVGGDGTASYSLPIDIPKGTAGMEPKISLGYSSGAGNGIAGLGWSLGGLQTITRGSSSVAKDGDYDPMDFDIDAIEGTKDRFYLNGERLVCVTGKYGAAGSVYRTEIDSFARITAVGAGPGSWKVETKAGLIMYLGETEDSRTAVTQGNLSWGVNRVLDTLGNYYDVTYTRDAATADFDFVNHRVSSIQYTGNATHNIAPYCSLQFTYEARPDVSGAYTTYAGYRSSKRLSKIRVLSGNYVNHSYRLGYETSYQSGRSLLKSVGKYAEDDVSQGIPVTTFNYDGLKELSSNGTPTQLWRNPGNTSVPVYGGGLDATGEVNSVVNTESDGTLIRLTGDVARAYRLATPVAVNADTRISFQFKSSRQVSGALIGLDSNLSYEGQSSSQLYRIGGTGTITMAGGVNYSDANSTLPYAIAEDWKTFDLNIGSMGIGTKGYLILMCVDNNVDDGVDNAVFRDVTIYQPGNPPIAGMSPIIFNIEAELPRYADAAGKDLGIVAADLNSDGLVDLADWRAISYTTNSNSTLVPNTAGSVYRNTGGDFVPSTILRPPATLPLGCRSSDTEANDYNTKFHLLAQPMDVDGDGRTDLMGSINIQNHSGGRLKNDYAFYTLINNVWTEKTEWRLPFSIENTYPGARRDEHFQWVDLNSDGYQDLVIHTSAYGRLIDSAGTVILGSNAGTAYLNKGKNGPGWTRDDSYALPLPLMYNGADIGIRILDLDGDGKPDISKSRHQNGAGFVRKTFTLKKSGTPRWDPPTEDGIGSLEYYFLPSGLVLSSGNPGETLLLDLNGDGLVDIVKNIEACWLNCGKGIVNPTNGYNEPWKWRPPASATVDQAGTYHFPYPLFFESWASGSNARISYGFEPADINGDGLVDILYSDLDNTATTGSDNVTFMNTGSGWRARESWGIPNPMRFFAAASDRYENKRTAKLQDIDGDGFPDLVTGLLGQTPKVWFNNCKPEVMISTVDGFGAELGISYRRLNDATPTEGFGSRVYNVFTGALPPGHAAVIDSRLVVSRYSEPDGLSGQRWKSQRYGDLRYDRNNEASLGFGWIEALDESNGQCSRTEFRRDYPFAGSPSISWTTVKLTAADIANIPPNAPGYPALTPGEKRLTLELADYAEMQSQAGIGGTIRRPVQITSVKLLFDLDGTPKGATTTTQLLADFDSYGFVKKSTVTSLDGFKVEANSTYTHTTTNGRWHLGRLTNASVKKGYNLVDEVTKTSSFTYSTVTGLLTSEKVEPGSPLAVTTAYTHDAFGNVEMTSVTARPDISLSANATRSAATIYDSNGRFVTAESNDAGHTVTYAYDGQKALLQSTTDISGLTTYFTYDQFGTLIQTHHPDGTKTAEITGYAINASVPSSVSTHLTHSIRYFRAKQGSGTAVAKVYLDALGRELVTETTILRNANATGPTRYRQVYAVTKYDNLGRKTAVSEAFAANETPLFTTIQYDILSRPIKTVHPDGNWSGVISQGAGSFTSYLGAVLPATYSKVRNQSGQILERWEDEHGRLAQSKDPSGQITTFAYDAESRLKNAIINNDSLLTNIFDHVGNKIGVIEANSGYSQSQYNGFGELVRTLSARGDETVYTYDSIGRPKKVTKPEGTYTTTYSQVFGPALGKPLSITGSLGAAGYLETFSYDSLGRPIATSKTQFGETFTTSTTYDALGRVSASTDAGGLIVFNEYDPTYSFPLKRSLAPGTYEGAGAILWKAGTYDSKGRPIFQSLALGVSTTAAYDPVRGDLTDLTATRASGTLQDKGYVWDGLGNLTSRTDSIAGRLESFGYDHLNRLASSSVSSLAGAPTSTVPPPQSYAYSTNSNLLTKGSSATLIYGSATRIHAVTSATVKGSARSYAYDDAGYVVSDGKRTYQWTSFGQLRQLDYATAPDLRDFSGNLIHAASRVTSTFDFDSGGNRARQTKERIAANDSRKIEFTLYLGSYEREIHQNKANAGANAVLEKTVHRHSLGGGVVYTRTTGGSDPGVKLMAVLADHLGSTDVIVTGKWNTSTAAFANITTERQSFDAWGERRAADTQVNYRATDTDPFRTSAQEHHRGYTGHEQLDDSGLIHMNGRIYDPELGRFLSPDPYVQIPEYSQNFNRYSYVLNNPLNATDPSGFSFLSKFFSKVGSWISENWRTVVSIVVGVALFFALGPGAFGLPHLGLQGAQLGAAVGASAGAFNAAINGGDLGDILRGSVIGGIQGGITGGILHDAGLAAAEAGFFSVDSALHIAGHGVVGGAANEAMGGKFQDGFLSAAISAAASNAGAFGFIKGNGPAAVAGRTAVAGIVGGTASVLGGGKFANGAYTSAFQHLLNAEILHPLAKGYDATKDLEWQDQIKSSNKFITEELSKHKNLFTLSIHLDLDPRLVMAIIVNETRGWGAHGGAGLGAEYFLSTWKSLIKSGRFGNASIGPAQLGVHARSYSGTTHLEALTFDGAARGAMSFLSSIRTDLIKAGIPNPNSAQIASRYNAALVGHAPGTITKYGLQVREIINSELYE